MRVEYDCTVCGEHVIAKRSPANGGDRAKFCSPKCHGLARRGQDIARNRLRKRWWAMLDRCENPRSTSWSKYGARGITVCARWHDFEFFLADMGYPPDGTTLDRIENNGPYSPENCRWATPAEQRLNQRPRSYKRAVQCGTKSGYYRHRRNREPLCADCRSWYKSNGELVH